MDYGKGEKVHTPVQIDYQIADLPIAIEPTQTKANTTRVRKARAQQQQQQLLRPPRCSYQIRDYPDVCDE